MSETIDRQMSDIRELSQSQVPLERVAPLNSNRLVTFVNHFIVSIVQQLNELSSVVDSRLFDINNQIIRCNTNLLILEMKLNSISGLSSVPTAADGNTTAAATEDTPIPPNDSRPDNNTPDMSAIRSDDSVETEANNDTSEAVEETEAKPEEPEDPRLTKYKKMVQLGIPLAAVHQKMSLEGVDPQLLS